MGMIVSICMSLCMHMFAFIIKLKHVLIIYLISTYVHGFVLKLIHFLDIYLVPFTIWPYMIIPNSINNSIFIRTNTWH